MAGTSAFGTILAFGDGDTPEVFHKLGAIKDVSGPSLARDTIEKTNMNSPQGYREFIGGLRDAGEVSFDIETDFSATDQDATDGLWSIWDKDEPVNWKLITRIPATTGSWGFTFAAIVTKFEFANPMEDIHTASVTLKISGPISDPTDMTTTGII